MRKFVLIVYFRDLLLAVGCDIGFTHQLFMIIYLQQFTALYKTYLGKND